MGLLGEIQQHARRPGGVCCMVAINETLTVKDRAELVAAFADSSITHAAIFRALKSRSLPVTETGVIRHRKGECACRAS